MATANPFSLLADDDNTEVPAGNDRRSEVARDTAKKPAAKPRAAGGNAGKGSAGAGRGRGNRAPKREYDRHSGTGRSKNEMPKGGGGAHNWGSAGAEGGDDSVNQGDDAEDAKAEEERRAKEVSLDAYLKSKNAEREGLAAPAARSVAEDTKGVQVYKRDDDELAPAQQKKANKKKEKKAPKMATADFFGGAPQQQQQRPAGRGRGERNSKNAPNLADQSAFPTLG